VCPSLIRSKSVSGGWDDEVMTGDKQHDYSAARDAVADARREAARAQARLAEVAVRYADARIAEETEVARAAGVPRRQSAEAGGVCRR
jgi:hypothetical protein